MDRSDAAFPWPEGTALACEIWRGGTSRGVIFRAADLPEDPAVRDRMLLAAMGSPDARQIDGLGGANPLTSKVAIVEPSRDPEHDVWFTFAQVAVDRALVDYSGTCGNISSAVGPWAVLAGVVEPREGETPVRVLNTNTRRSFVAHVPMRDGRPATRGEFVVDGVPRPGAMVRLEFLRPEGGATGRLLPTGRLRDQVESPAGTVDATIVDVGNPTAVVRLADVGLEPGTATEAIRSSPEVREALLRIREAAGVLAGLADDRGAVPAHVPKLALVAPAGAYGALGGRTVSAGEVDLRAWALTMGQLHQAYPVTAGMATAVAARMDGTIAREVAGPLSGDVRIGHPSGVISIGADVLESPDGPIVERVVVGRTARRLMAGELALP